MGECKKREFKDMTWGSGVGKQEKNPAEFSPADSLQQQICGDKLISWPVTFFFFFFSSG